MLKQNTTIFAQYPLRFIAGSTLSGERVCWGQSERRNWFYGEHSPNETSGIPNGNLAPALLLMPQKSGGMASNRGIIGTGSVVLNLIEGRNLSAGLTGSGGISNANMGLVILIIAALTGTGTIAANIKATSNIFSNIVGLGSVTSNLSSAAELLAALLGNSVLTGLLLAPVNLSSDLSGSGQITEANLAGIAQILADLVGSGATTAEINAAANAFSSIAGTGDLTVSILSALANAFAEILGTSTTTGVANAYGALESDINVTGDLLTTANVAASVWNALAAAFNETGTMGQKLSAASSAGDPWGTDLPGAYAEGTAGFRLGTLVNSVSGTSSINVAASGFVLTVGAETNSYTDTTTSNGVYHTIDDVANNIDCYYEFNVGVNGIPVSMTALANLQSNNDTLGVYAWDWNTSSWVQIGSLPGTNNSATSEYSYPMFGSQVGQGADTGTVRIRFQGGSSNPRFDVDLIYVSYAIVESSSMADGIAQAGSNTTITLSATSSALENFYKPGLIVITSGTGTGQSRRIDSYDGSTKIATVSTPWVVNPDNTTRYAIYPWASVRVSEMEAEVIDAIWSKLIEAGFDAQRVLKIIASAVAGKASGGPGSPVFRNLGDTQNQITGTADSSGNRSAASYGS